ncbi:MAG TPA: hypothetical protein VMW18_00710 [Candidatus Binatia bacterium]|nr:hypothetical protein [Candidatus Binatia bacterium]
MRASTAVMALLLAGAAIPAAHAQDAGKPLTGDFNVGPALDAAEGSPADHIYLTLTGDAAKAMWDTMKVKTEPDECVGRMSKSLKGLTCYGAGTEMSGPLGPNDSPYECYIGINLKSATIDPPSDC